MTQPTKIVPIPEPSGLPLVGHTFSIPAGGGGSFEHLTKLALEIGPLYRLRFGSEDLLIASGVDLVEELADESRFHKIIIADLEELRIIGGDGLVTAHEGEPNWQKAHEILLPAFSQGAMRKYHDTMIFVIKKLIAKWDAAAEAGTPVDVGADATRLTLDMIGLIGFGFDFTSFERDEPHPFVAAMERVLGFAHIRSQNLPGQSLLQGKEYQRYLEDIDLMNGIVDEVIATRRSSGDNSDDDVLGLMLTTPHPTTGELLDDLNIRRQVITFLIAGHETTSSLISYALMLLLKHPDSLARAQAEVDGVWGDSSSLDLGYNELGRLTYIRQVLDETLRVWPTSLGYQVTPFEDTTVLGKYQVKKGDPIYVMAVALHRQPEWGDNVELFEPERFSPERISTINPHAYKPFGNGKRACIGRQFALHEATMALGMVAHRYRLVDSANYQLRHKGTVTSAPADFEMVLRRRTSDERRIAPAAESTSTGEATVARRAPGTTLRVLYGSNLGTCSGIAEDLAGAGEAQGFAPTVGTLDSAEGNLTADDSPVIIVAASYNGEPTSDAKKFISWAEGLPADALTGVQYLMLGVGDRNWASTYQDAPKRIVAALDAAGATALADRGVTNVAGDFVGDVNRWTEKAFGILLDQYGSEVTADPDASADENAPLYTITETTASVTGELAGRHGLVAMEVIATRELVDLDHPLGRSKRFVQIKLPEGVTYLSGDHLAVLPKNRPELVARVAKRFGLQPDTVIRLTPSRRGRDVLPVDRPLTIDRLLSEVVELQEPASRADVQVLAEHTQCPPDKAKLDALLALDDDAFHQQVTGSSITVFDLIENAPAIEIPFVVFLELVPALKPRSYSISSSPALTPDAVDLMVSLVNAPHRSGEGTFTGVTSNYLQEVRTGDIVTARVLPCAESFRLPEDSRIPVIMVSAGTGLAPFRGAILDRLHAKKTGVALCYVGFDHPDVDYLHREQFEAAEAGGAVSMRPTFMHAPDGDIMFVQHRIAAEGDEVWSALENGGRVYVCGDGRLMAPAVREAFANLYAAKTGADHAAGVAWVDSQIDSGTYIEDVWA